MDHDDKMIYTKRKHHMLGRDTSQTSAVYLHCTDLPLPAPFCSRVETDKHISQTGKNLGRDPYHTLPTGMASIGHPIHVMHSVFLFIFFCFPKTLGCMPDGKVVDCSLDSNEEKLELLEIKCPSSKFEVSPANACKGAKLCLKMQDNVPSLKKDHDYYDKVQRQMGFTGAKWCDFVVYTKAGMNWYGNSENLKR